MKKIPALLIFSALIGGGLILQSQAQARNEALAVHVENAYAYATTSVQKNGAVFATFENTGKNDIKIISASSPIAERTELHTSGMEDGSDMMRMREVDSLSVPAGESLTLSADGYHIMLFGLKKQLTKGESFPVTLDCADNLGITFAAEIKNPGDVE